MTRRFLCIFVLALAGWLTAPSPSCADAAGAALVKSAVLEGNVAYLRVGQVETNLAAEIRKARSTLAVSNKIAGTILDLRFAGGDNPGTADAVEKLLAEQELPLAILVNHDTRGAAETLASALRAARVGLIFASVAGPAPTNRETAGGLRPDIPVAIGAENERAVMENPYATPATNTASSPPVTNGLLPFVDYTSEADLVRAKIKDGDGAANPPPPRKAAAPPTVMRDPVLARAMDLIKGLAIVRAARS